MTGIAGAAIPAPGPAADARAVERALQAATLTLADFAALCSVAAEPYLEEMARRAQAATLRHFGRAIQLYTPLYLSDHCDNACAYCGFRAGNAQARRTLTVAEARAEAEAIAGEGFAQVLLLTGDSRRCAPVAYLCDCVAALHPRFASIGLEIYALAEDEYARLSAAGADTLTIYQETYERELYARVHPRGPKADYDFRYAAPLRAARAGMRAVTLGVLLGLGDWRAEARQLAAHAAELHAKAPAADIGFALPRVRPQCGGFAAPRPVADRHLVQLLCALRLLAPRAPLTISTRESAALRDALLPLGVTHLSAGSHTAVGARTTAAGAAAAGQFAIDDRRSLAEVMAAVRRQGYLPVLKDWWGAETAAADMVKLTGGDGRE